ncbi:NAD(P)H-binding protein [Cellulomonas sp. HD19AZ1]|uniref:NAD(P)H-binding protein n=1 Tax=Cellulomonas sp. HD19AZ1 TaxID=2559593 RepID=UPI00107121FE|nr:NAD(P)H-binding protein [Cellulomonas sp. HD19AZ1]TFH68206.1 NAD-dependent epimerase/dehydratase family protein [Cellulomonas sp. HD19AZ1]
MVVLVVGASGAVGGAVVAGLLERGVEVRATSRTPERLSLPSQVRTSAADLDDPASFDPALEGVERVFLYADMTHPEPLLARVAAAGVRHVVLLSSSAVTAPGAADDFNGARFLRVERAVEDSGVAHTFLRPGGFASNVARWSWSIRTDGTVPLPHPAAAQVPVHEADVADVAVVALTGDALLGAAPVLTGPQVLTLREQVATIGDVLGRDVRVVEQTEAESAALLARHVPEVWVRQIIGDWRAAVGATPAVSREHERLTGRPARTFRTWVEDHVDLFR